MVTKETTELLDDWVISRINHSTQNPNIGFVETLYHTCSAGLVHLWRSQFRFVSHGPHKNTLKKDVAYLRLWEESFPPGRLDTVLEHSRYLKMNVVENLNGIGNILTSYFVGCEGTVTNSQNENNSTENLEHELRTQLEKAAIMLCAEEPSDSSSDDDESDDSSLTIDREQSRYGRLHCYISCLMDLAPVIERHISCLQHKVEPRHAPLEKVFRLSESAQPFAMRIRDRFTGAPTYLVERLAESNWERSIRIRAQEEKLAEEDRSVNRDTLTFFKPYSIFQDSGLGTSIHPSSQYAATAASNTSFLSISGEEARGRPKVPPLPLRGRFQCPYCRKTIYMRNRIEWKMHVFADLQSYLCTHPECKDALKTFSSREQWAQHEFNEHFCRVQWRCFTCNMITDTQQLFVDHLVTAHDTKLAGHGLAVATSNAKETVLKSEFKDHTCALCSQAGWKTRKAYAIHVGQHLEEISLACLPRDEDDLFDSDSDTSTNVAKATFHRLSNPSNHRSPNQIHSLNDAAQPATHDGNFDVVNEKGRCSHPDCGRIFKDLQAHMLTHRGERPEKCPIATCEYHIKGFARKYDKNRHTLTHFKGTMVCAFCRGSGSPAETSFNRADVFKRHLTSVHGVEQTIPNCRRRNPTMSSNKKPNVYCSDVTGKCSTCSVTFSNAQDFYEHLDDCILRIIQQEESSEAINQTLWEEVPSDEEEKHMLLEPAGPVDRLSDCDDYDDNDGFYDFTTPTNQKLGKMSSNAGSRRVVGSNNVISMPSTTTNVNKRSIPSERRNNRDRYPQSWGRPTSSIRTKKVLCVFDGQRRLWNDEMMLDNEFEARVKLPGGAGDGTNREAYITDLEVETSQRLEGVLSANDEERGPPFDLPSNRLLGQSAVPLPQVSQSQDDTLVIDELIS